MSLAKAVKAEEKSLEKKLSASAVRALKHLDFLRDELSMLDREYLSHLNVSDDGNQICLSIKDTGEKVVTFSIDNQGLGLVLFDRNGPDEVGLNGECASIYAARAIVHSRNGLPTRQVLLMGIPDN